MQEAKRSLLTTSTKSLIGMTGAYTDITELVENLLQEYVDVNALLPSSHKRTTTIDIKLTLDNTLMFHGKLEGVYLSLLDVDNLQSVKHQAIVAIAKMKESNENLVHLANRAHLRQFFRDLPTIEVKVNNRSYSLSCYLTLDWMGLVGEIGFIGPQWASDDEIGCPFCGILIGVLRHSWWKNPFQRYHCSMSITDFPNAVFPELSLEQRRYCGMHLSNANLSNTLTNTYNLFLINSAKRTAFLHIVHQVGPKWKYVATCANQTVL